MGFPLSAGGEATLSGTFINDGPIVGRLAAADLVLKDAPTVAKLLSVGSLDGLENVLNGEGLEFSRLEGDLQLEDGVLRLVDARMTGSALGVSANGTVDLADTAFSIHGAIAPAYGVNSLAGNLPGIGSLFVSREGEGLFALAYRLNGPPQAATVEVNTIAALTPGILRRLFEPTMETPPSTAELLLAAEAIAAAGQALDAPRAPQETRLDQNQETSTSSVDETGVSPE